MIRRFGTLRLRVNGFSTLPSMRYHPATRSGSSGRGCSRRDLASERYALIESRAKYLGLSVDDYLRGLLPADEMELGLRPDAADEDFEADMAAFAEASATAPTDGATAAEGTTEQKKDEGVIDAEYVDVDEKK